MKTTRVRTVIAIAAAAALASCAPEQKRANTRICEYLYGVEYANYDFDACVEAVKERMPAPAACSEVRRGDFVGRNLDWYINTQASAVIKVGPSDGRLASLGMVGCIDAFNEEMACAGEYDPVYELLPAFTVDGINERGFYAGVNVAPTGETSLDPQSWETGKWGHGAAFTNPSSDRTYCVTILVRYLLDNAASLDHARKLVEEVNWYEPYGFPHPGESQAFHWLLSDATSSAVLEFIDNRPVFIQTDNVSEPSYATLMTNFSNSLMESSGLMQTTGMGYERWDLLAADYSSVPDSAEGMEQLMSKVWYTHLFTDEPTSEGYFFTEFASARIPAESIYRNTSAMDNELFANAYRKSLNTFRNHDEWHHPDSNIWYTTHTSVYCISDRSLRVITHEGLEEQKDFYTAEFDCSFNRPMDAR